MVNNAATYNNLTQFILFLFIFAWKERFKHKTTQAKIKNPIWPNQHINQHPLFFFHYLTWAEPIPTVASCIRKSLYFILFIIIVIFYVCENQNYPTVSQSSHAHCSHLAHRKRPIVNCYKMPSQLIINRGHPSFVLLN